jgi:methyl-accepting chemotaxis protein
MGLKQKFIALAGVMGALMAIVSIIGYYIASGDLQKSVESEMRATVQTQAAQLDGWLNEKKAFGVSTANHMTSLNGNTALLKAKDTLGTTTSDKEILEMTAGLEDGYFYGYYSGDNTGKKDPTQRPWYKDAKAADKALFTEAYTDTNTGKLVLSVAVPVKSNGQFIGATCTDISLDVLTNQANNMKYQGEGVGIILEKSGNILATSGAGEPMKSFKDIDGLGKHFDEMIQKGEGYFNVTINGTDKVFAYTTVPATGWVVGISAPYDFVFASLKHLKLVYGILTVIGLLLAVGACLAFASRIMKPIAKLEAHAAELAEGNLSLDDLPITSSDEIGTLTNAFNVMSGNIRKMITHMATTAEQVAASSEELTANAQQSADAAVHVAETVGEVSMGMSQQLTDIDGAKKSVDTVYTDITSMADKAHTVTDTSTQTAEAAQKGGKLMESAIGRMGNIEQSVMSSADAVRKLGENSQQIGQIVEAISSIAEQTNLLALNAAIEAARAGEHGRGFAVVAEEVRKLAAESQTSAEQIKDRIASIQRDTAEAVASMEAGTDEVKSGTAAIREVGVQFSDILSMVNGIKSQMEEINASVQTVSNGAGQIVEAVDSIDTVSRNTAKNTQTISAATEEQSASNEEIAAASQALAKLATDMQTAMSQFKI